MDKAIIAPLVSIIMPAYNAETYIRMAIDSVLSQTFKDWELIVVDDGSTDDTANVVKEYLLIDSRVKYFYQENGKQGKARNLAISKSKGQYLAFLDADDLWLSDKLEIQIKEIESEKVDLVFSDSYVFSDSNIFDTSKKMNTLNQVFHGKEALKIFLRSNRIPILTVLAKKDKVLLADRFSEKKIIQNVEDYHLWLKMLISGCTFYGSNKILASYRVHSKSSTGQDTLLNKRLIEVYADLLKDCSSRKQLFYRAIKRTFRKQYDAGIHDKSDLYNLIIENCNYLNKQHYAVIYRMANYLVGPRITIKFLKHFLNS